MQVEYYALAGLALIRQTAELVRDLNPDLAILGLVLTFFDARKTLNKDVAAALADEWGDALFSTRIRDNVSLAEAPSNGQDVFSYCLLYTSPVFRDSTVKSRQSILEKNFLFDKQAISILASSIDRKR